MIEDAIKELSLRRSLPARLMEEAMKEIMNGLCSTDEIVEFLTKLSEKGETVEELTSAAKIMRQYASKIETKQKIVLDTCGTGGDNLHTFNISTAVAFVVSGAGIAVAKHGNRSVSSKSGSADVLEALGVNINLSLLKAQACLDNLGITFLFAQNFHPAMKYAMPARKKIGRRTMFNILGPLSNPAGATHQLIGVYDRRWTEILAKVLANLGTKHALIVHGEDGLDEITTTAKTFIAEEKDGRLKSYEILPEDFGFKRASLEDLQGRDAAYNATVVLDVLNGKGGPARDIVLLNAAAGIYAADRSKTIAEALVLAKKSLDTGKALEKLNLLKQYSAN